MKSVLQFLGLILILLGVVVLVLYAVMHWSNIALVVGLAFEIIGLVLHIVVNKRG